MIGSIILESVRKSLHPVPMLVDTPQEDKTESGWWRCEFSTKHAAARCGLKCFVIVQGARSKLETSEFVLMVSTRMSVKSTPETGILFDFLMTDNAIIISCQLELQSELVSKMEF